MKCEIACFVFILLEYQGHQCIVLEGCQIDPCINDGECTKINGTYACECPTGWEGPTCSKDTDDCLVNPCQNNGTCEGISVIVSNSRTSQDIDGALHTDHSW